MISTNVLIAVALAYVAFLFAIAALADRQVRRGQFRWLKSPLVYTLSLSVYCTAWTFYGAVGSAVRNGLEFLAIYLGPTILFVGWFWILRKLVRIGRTQRITSIADLISSRYGKSTPIAAVVTILAVIASTPYIALQLQSLTISYEVLTAGPHNPATIAFWFAAGLALFTILFGTRNVDANERHHGVVTAIAFEAIVKLVAVRRTCRDLRQRPRPNARPLRHFRRALDRAQRPLRHGDHHPAAHVPSPCGGKRR